MVNQVPALVVPGASMFKKDWATLPFIELVTGRGGEPFVTRIVSALSNANYMVQIKSSRFLKRSS